MELDDYRTILALIQTGSLKSAAHRLHRVPSALSMRIKAMEERLGCTLFVRNGRFLEPTATARKLAETASTIINLSDNAVALITGKVPGGLLRLGALDSIAGTRLPELLTKLTTQFSSLELSLTIGVSEELCQAVLDSNLDAAFLIDAPKTPSLTRKAVFQEKLVLITRAGHKPIKTPADLEHNVLLAFSPGCSYRERMLDWYQTFNTRPERIIEVKSYAAIIGCVAAGMGIAAVPESLIKDSMAKTSLLAHKLPASISQATVELVYRTQSLTQNLSALEAVLNDGKLLF